MPKELDKNSLLFFEWDPGDGNPKVSQTWLFDATDDEDAREQVAKFIAEDKRRKPERLFREIPVS